MVSDIITALKSEQLTSRRGSFKKSVLLVDDDAFVLRSEKRQLGLYFDIATANGAENAAVSLMTGGFDAIITDFDMPGYNGIWLLEQVAGNFPGIKRIMVLARDQSIFLPYLESGLIHYFYTKPINMVDVINSINV
ncbi:MAG: response regulator [Deltaproteobacteria bacterium]|nr:response regulator [Deltaproteobacteria bacterium]